MLLNNKTESSTEPLSDNSYIDGILWGGKKWSDNSITYSFNSGGTGSKRDWSKGEREVIEEALASWESVANIEFVPVEDDDPNANLKFNLDENLPDDILGMFNPPGEASPGEGHFNWQELGGTDFKNLKPGSENFLVIVHEIGHGLGLAHPHDTAGGSNVYPGLYTTNVPEDSFGTNGLNQGVWTTMSYNEGFNDAGFQGSPMAFDIAAIQHLYGENTKSAKGNNTYTLPRYNGSDTYYKSIWDTDGVDTIVTPSTFGDATIDLRDAPLEGYNAGGYISSVKNINGGFTIANGVEIENARGSSGDDELIGNGLANELVGNSGADTLIGGKGKDTLLGGSGNDVLTGSDPEEFDSDAKEFDRLTGNAGADTFILGNSVEAYYKGIGYGRITDFDELENDVIQLSGSASDYRFEEKSDGTFIRRGHDAVGFVEGEKNLLFNDNFEFV